MKLFSIVLIIIINLIESTAIAKNPNSLNLGDVIVDQVVSVSNAGTFKVDAMNTPGIYLYHINIYIANIVTPKLYRNSCKAERKKALLAKKFVAKKLYNAQKIELHNIRQPRYSRIISDVFVDGVNLAKLLVDEGLAVYKDNKKNWCEH